MNRKMAAAMGMVLAATGMNSGGPSVADVAGENRAPRMRGRKISGREPFVSPRRRERRRLMAEHGITTGRQWVRLRKRLRLRKSGGVR